MYSHGPFFSFTLLLFLVVVLMVPASSISDSDADNYSECVKPTELDCGGQTFSVSYPFGSPKRSTNCSLPQFHLSCSDKNTIFFDNLGDNYPVEYINYNGSVFKASNFTGESCLPEFDTTLVDRLTVFLKNYMPTSEYVVVNCTKISCLGPSYYGSGPPDSCERKDIDQSIAAGEKEFWDAFQTGVGLTWSSIQENCSGCVHDGGACGYNSTDPDVVACYYKPPPSPNNTPAKVSSQNTGNKKSRHEAIGISLGVGGGLLATGFFFFFFLWYRRRKNRQLSSSPNYLIPTVSSISSSMNDPEVGSTNYYTQIFSYDELEVATHGFDASGELGDGGFGTVYKGQLKDGRVVAVKRLYESNYKRVEQFVNEVDILSRLHHPNLVTLYGCTSRHSRELLLVYEFISNGTVADHLHGPRASERALTWPLRLSIAIETADALTYLHANDTQIIHRDIKTNNILIDKNFHAKVADFGLSRLFPVHATHVSTLPQGTPGYVDPEYHQCYQLTDKSDVYSFGVVLVELISSKLAVDISRHRHEINLASMAINMIQNRELEKLIDPGLGYETDWEMERMINLVAELAFQCLQGDGEMRPSMKEVLEELRRIQRRGENGVEADVQTREDSRLLKNSLPYSPDSVTVKWESTSTTPNISA